MVPSRLKHAVATFGNLMVSKSPVEVVLNNDSIVGVNKRERTARMSLLFLAGSGQKCDRFRLTRCDLPLAMSQVQLPMWATC